MNKTTDIEIAPSLNYCPVARALDLVGDRWTLLIVRDLLKTGSCRYQVLTETLNVAPNTLSGRLKMLEANGFVERRFYSEYPPRAEYVLTDKGRSLKPIIDSFRTWGKKNTEAPT